MAKKVYLLAATTVFLFIVTSAQANMYVGVNGGGNSATDSDVSYTVTQSNGPDIVGEGEVTWDTGYWFSAVVGYSLEDLPIRMEAEGFYQGHDADTSTAYGVTGVARAERASFGMLANFYYDFVNSTRLTPFVGAGVGVSRIEVTDVTDDYKSVEDTLFAWQVGAGLSYAVTDSVSADLKYRYYRTNDISDTVDHHFDSGNYLSQEIENASHTILFGIRVEL